MLSEEISCAKSKKTDPRVKYYPPRLMERLEYIKDYPLTLVEAPSGFGKTTMLEHFLDTRIPRDVLCERCDFVQKRPKDGWRRLCAMLAGADEKCSERLLAIGAPDEDTLPRIAAALAELRCPEEAYIWLDDFMNWSIPMPGEFLNALSKHGGKGLHIIVSTHPLSKEKRAGLFPGENILRLRVDSFVFGLEDIDSYFRAAGVSLTRTELMEAGSLPRDGSWR